MIKTLEVHYEDKDRTIDFPALLKERGLRKGVEVGVREGAYGDLLLQTIPGLELYGVDINDVPTFYTKTIRKPSTVAANGFRDGTLDFVYIDASHNYQHVMQDLTVWARKIRPGGIVAGHEFLGGSYKKIEVKGAVLDWCVSNSVSPLHIYAKDSHPSWWYAKC